MGNRKVTQEEFLERVKKVHGDKYDYADAVYENMHKKVVIICRKHGPFTQAPMAHLKGQGCPICGREIQKQSVLKKYGVDNPMKVPDVQAKARETCRIKYGHDWAASSHEVQSLIEATNLEKHGARRPIQAPQVYAKMRATVRSQYGVDFAAQIPAVRDKIKATFQERYGVDEILSHGPTRDKIIETNISKYGGPAPMSSEEIRDKASATLLAHYGVEHVADIPGMSERITDSKIRNGTIGTSRSEVILFQILKLQFGENGVIAQYRSDDYPFACDYYIPERGLYIELNALWTHGGHWFDSMNLEDISTLAKWQDRGTLYYQNAIDTWSVRDVHKRNVARQKRLRYVVFWDSDLKDVRQWIERGCPDGCDWDVMYSWL